MVTVKEQEFLEAFKEVFWYQARKKFGLSGDVSTVGKYVRPLLLVLYVILLYFFTQNHYDIPLILLTLVGCTWLSIISVDSIKMIYHRRCTLGGRPERFRDVKDFTCVEKLVAYLISAFVVTGIFAGSMFLITFIRTGVINLYVFVGMASIPPVLIYHLRNDCSVRRK